MIYWEHCSFTAELKKTQMNIKLSQLQKKKINTNRKKNKTHKNMQNTLIKNIKTLRVYWAVWKYTTARYC